ncbi:hypothetical protein GCM10009678_28060 [Actinomadura kijaniata]|uniref:Uncharacterized protein n=1 Tax=Actinomadura namibiensis TaxID=182080 RepID=A0A7W3QJR7_ACTNM|nr:hypothetical protein [Actinomadura namibiensis]
MTGKRIIPMRTEGAETTRPGRADPVLIADHAQAAAPADHPGAPQSLPPSDGLPTGPSVRTPPRGAVARVSERAAPGRGGGPSVHGRPFRHEPVT